MKKIIILLLLLIACNSWAKNEFSFRDVKFGMSKDEVLAFENGKLLENHPEELTYLGDTPLFPDSVFSYFFTNNELDEIVIYLGEPLDNNNADKADKKYKALIQTLTEKYGQIKLEQTYKGNPPNVADKHIAVINHILDDTKFIKILMNFLTYPDHYSATIKLRYLNVADYDL